MCAGLCRNLRRGCCERVHLKGRGEGQDDTQHCKTNKKSGNSHTRTLLNHICLNWYFQGTGKSGWCVIINQHLNWFIYHQKSIQNIFVIFCATDSLYKETI